jgi:uncharacterized membrane protein YfcA
VRHQAPYRTGVPTLLLALLAWASSSVGALGGLGGAVVLVPVLVLAGEPAAAAAPLGLLSVAAGSVAAAPFQLRERAVNHRLGVATELAATSGAVVGAVLSGAIPEAVLVRCLAVVALAAAFAGARRRGMRNPPLPGYGPEHIGERPGSLAGAYPVAGGVAPYEPRRVRAGLVAMTASGLVAGVAGVSGGFIKTPATTEIMHVPVKVAAATTTFTIGVTSAAALLVFAGQGRVDLRAGAAVVLGSLLGGRTGASLQARLSPPAVRRALSAVLVAVAAVLLVTG